MLKNVKNFTGPEKCCTLPLFQGDKRQTDTEQCIISSPCRFCCVAPNGILWGQTLYFVRLALPRIVTMLGRKSRPFPHYMPVLYLICNIFSLLLHNFNVFGVNIVTMQNTILYFMEFNLYLVVSLLWCIFGRF